MEDEDAPPKRLRRASVGEAARDWKCTVKGCTSMFKSVREASHVLIDFADY